MPTGSLPNGKMPSLRKPTACAVIVGDSLTSDIRGGINAGIRTIWFNPKGEPAVPEITADHELGKLKDLQELLRKL